MAGPISFEEMNAALAKTAPPPPASAPSPPPQGAGTGAGGISLDQMNAAVIDKARGQGGGGVRLYSPNPDAPASYGAPDKPLNAPEPPFNAERTGVTAMNGMYRGLAFALGLPFEAAATVMPVQHWKSLPPEEQARLKEAHPQWGAVMDLLTQVHDHPKLGMEWWRNLFSDIGLLKQDVKPQNVHERAAEAGGEMASAIVGPGMTAEVILAKEWNAGTQMLSGILKSAELETGALGRQVTEMFRGGGPLSNFITGLFSGAGGQYAKEAAPDSLKPAAEVAGQVAGGFPAAAAETFIHDLYAASARRFYNLFHPTEATNMRAAATIGERADRDVAGGGRGRFEQDLRNTEQPNPNEPNPAPGAAVSDQTAFQATGNQGVGQLEKEIRGTSQGAVKFAQRDAEQSNAQVDALQRIADPAARAQAVQDYLKQRLEEIKTGHAENVKQVTSDAVSALNDVGGTTFSHAGDYEGPLRSGLDKLHKQADEQADALLKAIDKDGTITVDTGDMTSRIADVAATVAKTAKPIGGEEKGIVSTVAELGPTESFSDVVALRQRLVNAIRAARAGTTQDAKDSAARMTKMLGAVEDTLETSAGQAARENPGILDGLRTAGGEAASGLTKEQAASAPVVYGVVGDDVGAPIFVTSSRETAEQMAASKARPSAVTRRMENDYDVIPFRLREGAQVDPTRLEEGASVPYASLQSQSEARASASAERRLAALDAAKERAGAASEARADVQDRFESGPVGEVLARNTRGDYRVDSENVASNLFDSPERLAAFARAAGDDPRLHDAMADYAAFSMRKAAARDGVISPQKLEQWIDSHKYVFEHYPDLMTKFRTAADAQEQLDLALARQKQAIDDFQSDAVKKVIGSGNVTDTVGTAISSPGDFGALVDRARADPSALAGMKRAVVDFMLATGRGLSPREAGTTGRQRINGDAIITFLNKNAEALGKLFSPAEMANMRNVAIDIQRTNRSIDAAGGRDQAERTATGLGYYIIRHMVAAAGAIAGHALGPGVGHVFAGREAGLMAGAGADIYLARRTARVNDAIADMLLDKNLASAWLAKYSAREASRPNFQDMLARRVRAAEWGMVSRQMEERSE